MHTEMCYCGFQPPIIYPETRTGARTRARANTNTFMFKAIYLSMRARVHACVWAHTNADVLVLGDLFVHVSTHAFVPEHTRAPV